MKNPFTPNFGQVPLVVAGRDLLIDEVSSAFDNAPGDPNLTSIFVGTRGSGKTALLSLLANDAQSRGWLAVNVPCVEGMLEEIAQGAALAASDLADIGGRAKLTGFTLGQLFGAEWDNDKRPEPTWFIRMSSILDALQEQGVGLVITVDEVRPSLGEMIKLASYYQLFVREERKIALLMAGLPSEVSALLNDKSVSFLRRASQYRLERIADDDVRDAFAQTAEQSGKAFEEDALGSAVSACDGFPFMIQLVGYRSWQAAGGSSVVDGSAVAAGIGRAAEDMKTRVLRATLDELSDRDLDYLKAMLRDESVSLSGEIARRIKQSDGYASQYRRRLLERGVIGTRGRGRVAFELPMLKEYLPEYLEGRS